MIGKEIFSRIVLDVLKKCGLCILHAITTASMLYAWAYQSAFNTFSTDVSTSFQPFESLFHLYSLLDVQKAFRSPL